MAEVTLQQIAELMDQKFAVQSAQVAELVRQELAAVEERMDQKFAAQTAQITEMVDQKLAEQKAHHDQRLDQVVETLQEVVETAGLLSNEQVVRMEQLKVEIKSEVRALAENVEGRRFTSLEDDTNACKRRLDKHEVRITKLEAAGH
jgi:hypothetical protein